MTAVVAQQITGPLPAQCALCLTRRGVFILSCCSTCARALVHLSSACFTTQYSMQRALSRADLPAARRLSQWRAAFGSWAPRRGSAGSQNLGNALGGRSALPTMQRQRRPAAAASSSFFSPPQRLQVRQPSDDDTQFPARRPFAC